MSLTSRFIFVAILFVCALKVTLANEWIATMSCSAIVRLRVQHTNIHGTQVIVWSPLESYPDNTLCDTDQIICIKDVEFQRTGCERAAFDFKVQYGNMWSRYVHVNLVGIKPEEYYTTISELSYFDPIFIFKIVVKNLRILCNFLSRAFVKPAMDSFDNNNNVAQDRQLLYRLKSALKVKKFITI
ncbi:hypothetical protein EDC96DRAFT_545059 [Choanephora cucurbitarum]|nr:hypothetical protein EDC96DRAFT_545059 [Choanephora cucurbitarum]